MDVKRRATVSRISSVRPSSTVCFEVGRGRRPKGRKARKRSWFVIAIGGLPGIGDQLIKPRRLRVWPKQAVFDVAVDLSGQSMSCGADFRAVETTGVRGQHKTHVGANDDDLCMRSRDAFTRVENSHQRSRKDAVYFRGSHGFRLSDSKVPSACNACSWSRWVTN